MSKILGENDRLAIDLLMNRDYFQNGKPSGKISFADSCPPAMWHRVQSLEKLLQLLSSLPTIDPPADLARNTLLRVQELEKSPVALATKPSKPFSAHPSRPL